MRCPPLFGRTVTVALVALLAAAPVAAQDASPSPVASPDSFADTAALASAFDASLASLTSPEAVSDAARELRTLDRDRLAAIDPGLPDALDELEAQSAADLAAWLEKPGAPPIEVTDAGEATVIVDVCPNEDGTMVATATTSATVDAAGNGLTYRVAAEANDTARATVNFQANVASAAHTGTVTRHATGDRAIFASGGEGDAESHLTGSVAWTAGPSGDPTSPATVEVDIADVADVADVRAWVLTRALAAALTDGAVKAASQVWRGGRCLELKADPPGKEVEPGSRTDIKVTIHHTAHEDEIERDVTATLAGTREVAPPEPTRAPVTFTYTATSASEGEGTITFKSVSNRGIAKELTETYTVSQDLRIDVDATTTMELGGMVYRGTARSRDLRVDLVPGATPTDPVGVTVEGDIEMRGRISGLLGQLRCRGRYRMKGAVDANVDASARLVGDGDDRRLVVNIAPASPDESHDFSLTCSFGRAPHSIRLADFWPVRGKPMELPLTGGEQTVRQSAGATRSVTTVTLRDEAR